MTDAIHTERRGRVLIITMDRPEAKNAINGELATGLWAAVQELNTDPGLTAEYFNFREIGGFLRPDETQPDQTPVHDAIDFDSFAQEIGGSGLFNFASRWTGQVEVDQQSDVTFALSKIGFVSNFFHCLARLFGSPISCGFRLVVFSRSVFRSISMSASNFCVSTAGMKRWMMLSQFL